MKGVALRSAVRKVAAAPAPTPEDEEPDLRGDAERAAAALERERLARYLAARSLTGPRRWQPEPRSWMAELCPCGGACLR